MQLHIPSTLAIDVQAVYPLFLIPKILHGLPEWYITFSGDPLVKGAFHGGADFNWFRSFFFLEACVGTGSFPIVLGETDSAFLGASNFRRFLSLREHYGSAHRSYCLTIRSCSHTPLPRVPRRSVASPSCGRPPV